MTKIRTIHVGFVNEIDTKEVSLFRGAILHLLDKSQNLLYHNHETEGFRYRYPLIQYKRIQKKASIMCLNEGADTIGLVLSRMNERIFLGKRPIHLDLESVKSDSFDFKLSNNTVTYTIRDWLPLNQNNYEEYTKLEGLAEKSLFLERVLIGNMLSMAKGLDVFIDQQVNCNILDLSELRWIYYKGVKVMSLDAVFKTNVVLPNYIGLGKGCSINHGTIVRIP